MSNAGWVPRRVVTTESAEGKATVWIDGPAENVKRPTEYLSSILLWATKETPAPYTGCEDAGAWVLPTAPPAQGTRFICIVLEPGQSAPGPMHKTDSLDYVICTEGTVTCGLDDGQVEMRAGDALVQRGTNHVWHNGGATRAVIFIVLIDGTPKRNDSVSGRQEAR